MNRVERIRIGRYEQGYSNQDMWRPVGGRTYYSYQAERLMDQSNYVVLEYFDDYIVLKFSDHSLLSRGNFLPSKIEVELYGTDAQRFLTGFEVAKMNLNMDNPFIATSAIIKTPINTDKGVVNKIVMLPPMDQKRMPITDQFPKNREFLYELSFPLKSKDNLDEWGRDRLSYIFYCKDGKMICVASGIYCSEDIDGFQIRDTHSIHSCPFADNYESLREYFKSMEIPLDEMVSLVCSNGNDVRSVQASKKNEWVDVHWNLISEEYKNNHSEVTVNDILPKLESLLDSAITSRLKECMTDSDSVTDKKKVESSIIKALISFLENKDFSLFSSGLLSIKTSVQELFDSCSPEVIEDTLRVLIEDSITNAYDEETRTMMNSNGVTDVKFFAYTKIKEFSELLNTTLVK